MNTAQKIINVVVKFTQQGLENIQTQINNLNNTTKDFNKSAKDASKSSKGLGDELKNTGNAANNAGKQTEGASKSTRSFASSVGRAINIVAQFTIAMYAVQAVQKTFSFFTIDAARAAVKFERSMKSLQAIANVSSDDLARFEKVIFDVAGSTRFTAGDIAELQKELSRLGFTADEVVQSTESIARFAEAIGADLGQAAQFVGKQLQAFGLSASSAFEITNAFTSLINNSALSMETLATSMQYASSISATLGVSLQETGALLGVLTNNGITASRAGTGLRQIFLELGADGGSLISILDDLAEQNISLSEAEELVGKRAAGALSVLIRQREEIRSLISAQDSLVSATIASARQNSTFAGQLDAVNAQINKIQINIGEWITKSNILIKVLEILGGGTDIRAFNVIDNLGLSDEELKNAIKNVDGLSKAIEYVETSAGSTNISVDGKKIEEIFGTSYGRSLEIARLLSEMGSETGKNVVALTNYLREMGEEVNMTEKASSLAEKATSDFATSIDDLSKKAKEGVKIDEERDALYEKLTERQYELSTQLAQTLPNEREKITILSKESELVNRLISRLLNLKIEREKEAKATEDTIKSFRELYNLEKSLNEAIREGDIPLAERLSTEYQDALQALEKSGLTEEYQDFARKLLLADAGTIEELVNQYKDIIAEIIRAQEIGDDVALDKANAKLEELLQKIQILGIGKDFESVYDYIFDEESRKRGEAQLAESRKNLDKENKELEKYLKRQDALDDAFGELGLIGRFLYGSGHKKAGESEEEFIERIKSVENELQKATMKIAEAGVDAALDATQRRLEAEQEAVDARYTYEEDRLQSLLQSNLITQAEYERKREQLERERIQKTNEIEKKQFEADKMRAIVDIAISTAKAVAEFGFVTPQALIAIAAGAVQTGIVASQKFVPVQFEEGGMVQGRSHREGGVPFTVQGIGGYEMEGGEYIVNKKATAKYLPMLEQINSYGRVNNSMFKHFANGGLTGMDGAMGMGESARINAMLLQRLNQPIRAYVSERELMTKSNERINQKMKSRL